MITTQIHCSREARERFKVMARIEGRTLSGYLDYISKIEQRKFTAKEYREAHRAMTSAKV